MRTVELPGGVEAVMSDRRGELTPRRRREIEVIGTRLGRLMQPLMVAARILCDGDVIEDRSEQLDDEGERLFDGPDVDLTENQLRLLSRMNDATTWALLRSWSLGPLPETPDDLLDIEPELYDALRAEAAKISVGMGVDEFSVDAVEDTESPTGD